MPSDSEQYFYRALNEKTQEARQEIQNCALTFLSPGSTHEHRKLRATAACDAIGRVLDMLHFGDRPGWLNEMHSQLKLAVANAGSEASGQFMHNIIRQFQGQLNDHRWKLADVDSGVDFDAIYEKYKAENRIPELFDAIIAALREIANSGQIDSMRALNELTKIIATLERARNGSYFATRTSWYFLVTWLKNSGWELFSEIPIAGALVRGLRKSLEDMDDGMAKMHGQVQQHLKETISDGFPNLEYRSADIPRLEHKPNSDVAASTIEPKADA